MFRGAGIERLVELLKQREASLYHACQLKDFTTYLKLGGIPSRQLMESSGLPFTAFDTDDVDHHNGVWDRVFVNLSDFGLIFSRGWAGVPNVYGPILLQTKPEALYEALDVAITLRSAGGTNFDRERESLATLCEVDRLFTYQADVLFGRDDLRTAFPERPIEEIGANPEVNCTLTKGFLSWGHLTVVMVDPYQLGKPLHRLVGEIAQSLGYQLTVTERHTTRKEWYQELQNHVASGVHSLTTIASDSHASASLRDWAKRASARKGMERQFDNYSRYIASGTFQQMG